MSTTRYDRYGRPAGYINPIEGAPEGFLIETNTNTQYICYYETGDQPRAIRRVMQDSTGAVQQIAVGWGAWADRATINYYPVNSVFIVDDDTKALSSVTPSNTPVSDL